MKTQEHVYVLYINDDINDIKYVGRTARTIEARLKEHLQDSKSGKSKKCTEIKKLLKSGGTIKIRIFETVPNDKAGRTEEQLIADIKHMGIVLWNTIESPGESFMYVVDDDYVASAWCAEDFEGSWIEHKSKGCKSNEVFKMIKGVKWFKNGNTSLRFDHPTFGKHSVSHIDGFNKAVLRAIDAMTNGTQERKDILESVERRKAWNGIKNI